MFGADIAAFLNYSSATSGSAFGGVRRLLDEQMDRLSELERDLLRALAVEREPVTLAGLARDQALVAGRGAVLKPSSR